MSSNQHILFGMGNPLLDISANVPEEMVKKYEVPLGSAILAGEKQMPVYKELVDNYKVGYIPGGSTQNTMRVFQWMMQERDVATYTGCVGKDNYADIMRNLGQQSGLNVQYFVDETTPTGTCAALVTGNERSLIANLGAANNFKFEYLKSETIQKYIEAAKYFYIEGFFLTVCPEGIEYLGKHAAENDKVFMMNLSALFIVSVFKDKLVNVIPYMDYLFGNDDEARAFAEAMGWNTKDVAEIAKKISLMDKVNKKRERVVVITQGVNPVVVAVGEKCTEYPVSPIPKEKIIDTNGAGDAFAAGFIAQLVKGESIDKCVRAGNYAAGVVIQHEGCKFP
jgi:adenosine kinase